LTDGFILDRMMRRSPRQPPIRPRASTPTPAALGYRMPAEFERQSGVWLAWPGVTTRLWAETAVLLDQFTALARTIRRHAAVYIAVDPAFADECAGRLGPDYALFVLPVDDIWMRDTGPTFLIGEQGAMGAVGWHFNVWGDKFDGYEQDTALAGHITRAAGARAFAAGLITEGGALHVDGDGTVVVTESALLNPNRNPGLTRRDAEEFLNASLGTRQVIWLPGGSGGDSITDGHVDGLMTFVKPGVALCTTSDDPAHPR
jgi:agmatine deiminase